MKTIKKAKKKDLNEEFMEALEILTKSEKQARKEYKLYIEGIVELCVNAQEGIFVSAAGTKNQQALRYNYSQSSQKIADKLLKKYAVMIKC